MKNYLLSPQGQKQGYLSSSLLFHTVLKVIANSIKKQTQKDYRLKRKSKFIFVFADNMIIYVENQTDSTNKQSE